MSNVYAESALQTLKTQFNNGHDPTTLINLASAPEVIT